jgi:hypothetical protein
LAMSGGRGRVLSWELGHSRSGGDKNIELARIVYEVDLRLQRLLCITHVGPVG